MKNKYLEKNIPIVRVKLIEDYQIHNKYNKVYGIEEAAPLFYDIIGLSTVEKLGLICIDKGNNILNASIVNIGTIDNIDISIGEIFRIALLSNAKYIIIAHNHPSGNIEPSQC
uniref:JAB domain-containing protein n=1 Tax=Clostridium sp. TaxID=1506 RepID=UPI002627134A